MLAVVLFASTAAAEEAQSASPEKPVKASVRTGRRAAKSERADRERADGERPRRKLRAGSHMELRARDVRLSEEGIAKLERIAARYHKATRRHLVVTGGTRTPGRQAELMLEKLAHGDDILKVYENKQAATEIRDAYRAAVAAAMPKKKIVRALREVIEAQIARGIYVSKHLRSGAIDVRSRGMSAAEERALRAAVAEEPEASLLDERGGAEPHFHLNL